MQEARAAGCRTSADAEIYIERKRKREAEENAHRVKENSQVGPSGKFLQRANHLKGETDSSPRGGVRAPMVLDSSGKDSSSTPAGLVFSNPLDDWDVTGLVGAELLSEAVRVVLSYFHCYS